jgi:hypothetical protein
MIRIQNPVSEMTIDMHCYLILIFLEKSKKRLEKLLMLSVYTVFALVDSY